MKQKNSEKQPCHDTKHKAGNPQAAKSATVSRPDAMKKSGGGNVKNIY